MNLLDITNLAPLRGEYQATVKDYKAVENDKGGYVEVTLALPDREYKYNLFPGSGVTEHKQINYFTGCIRNQLNLEGNLTLKDCLEAAKENPITVAFSYNEVYGRLNVNFHTQPEVQDVELTDLGI